jgi:hypothetical protein
MTCPPLYNSLCQFSTYTHEVQTWPALYRFSILFVNFLLLIVSIFIFSFPTLCLTVPVPSLRSSFTDVHLSQGAKTQLWNRNFVRGKKVLFTCLLPPSPSVTRVSVCCVLKAWKVDYLPPYFNLQSSYIGPRLRVLPSPSFPSTMAVLSVALS